MQVLWQESGWADYKILLPADVKWRKGTSLYNAVHNSASRRFFCLRRSGGRKGPYGTLAHGENGNKQNMPARVLLWIGSAVMNKRHTRAGCHDAEEQRKVKWGF